MSDQLFRHLVINPTVVELLHEAAAAPIVWNLLVGLAVAFVVLAPLERASPAHPRQGTWQPTILNLTYWFFTPLFTKVLANWVLARVFLGLLLALVRPVDASALDGFGPHAASPSGSRQLRSS